MQIRLSTRLPEAEIAALGGTFLNESAFDQLVQDDAEIYKPDGSPLLVYRRNVLSEAACGAAYPALRTAATKNGSNRGMAAGRIVPAERRRSESKRPAVISGTRWRPLKKDGTASNTDYSRTVPSGIIGYFDRYDRTPYCRLTAFNLNFPQRFGAALPFIREVDEIFERELPERYAAQKRLSNARTKTSSFRELPLPRLR